MNLKLIEFKAYLDQCELSEYNKKNYYWYITRIIKNCPKLNFDCVLKFCDSMGHADGTFNKAITAWKKYGRFMGWEWVEQLKRRKEPIKPSGLLTDEEIEWALKQYDYGSRDWMFINLFAFTAARPSELLKLTVNDVDLVNDTLTFWETKNGENRRIKIPKRVRQQLHDYMSQLKTFLLFPTLHDPNKHISVLTCRVTFYTALDKIHVTAIERKQRNIKFYHLKHSCITRLKQGGVDIVEMKDITGHKKLDSLLHYYQGDLQTMDKNFDKDRMSRDYLSSDEHFEQLVQVLQELDLRSISYGLQSTLVRRNNEISLKVKLKTI